MLILTDHDGVIVETIGDQQTLEDGRRIHLEVGGVWNERVVGTNGIGTALWTGEPVFVHAAEHFCAGIKPWSCAGVPVRDPFDNRVVGVVDLSGLIDIFRPHNTALVALAAQEIEEAMARRQNEERARLLETFLGSRLNTGHEDGVILLDRLGRVIYARRAPNRGADRRRRARHSSGPAAARPLRAHERRRRGGGAAGRAAAARREQAADRRRAVRCRPGLRARPRGTPCRPMSPRAVAKVASR